MRLEFNCFFFSCCTLRGLRVTETSDRASIAWHSIVMRVSALKRTKFSNSARMLWWLQKAIVVAVTLVALKWTAPHQTNETGILIKYWIYFLALRCAFSFCIYILKCDIEICKFHEAIFSLREMTIWGEWKKNEYGFFLSIALQDTAAAQPTQLKKHWNWYDDRSNRIVWVEWKELASMELIHIFLSLSVHR